MDGACQQVFRSGARGGSAGPQRRAGGAGLRSVRTEATRDRRDVTSIGSTTPAEHVDLAARTVDRRQLTTELVGVAVVEHFALVELGMTEPGGIRPNAAHAVQGGLAPVERAREVV